MRNTRSNPHALAEAARIPPFFPQQSAPLFIKSVTHVTADILLTTLWRVPILQQFRDPLSIFQIGLLTDPPLATACNSRITQNSRRAET